MMELTFVLVLVVLVVAVVLAGWFLAGRSKVITSPVGGGLDSRLAKPRRALAEALRGVFAGQTLDAAFWSRLEEALIAADVGVEAATEIVDRVKVRRPSSSGEARRWLAEELEACLPADGRSLNLKGRPAVIMVVGVNGTGKTTTIAKLAAKLKEEGRTVLLGAADTFRAAAADQLRTWGERVGVDVVGGGEGGDPAAAAFDAYRAASARGRNVLIVDTAGRLHAKRHLMEELGKIKRVLEREAGSVDEVLLVLDATAGQNGIVQAKEFLEAVGVTGIVLTKLDGTAKGGIVVAIERRLGIPVKLVGVGEGLDDLLDFRPHDFVSALLAEE